jgi:hypothetical protein
LNKINLASFVAEETNKNNGANRYEMANFESKRNFIGIQISNAFSHLGLCSMTNTGLDDLEFY